MPVQGVHIRFTDLKIQLRSQNEAKVDGAGDLFVNDKYVHFLADEPGRDRYYQCGFIPWDMISYINYNKR